MWHRIKKYVKQDSRGQDVTDLKEVFNRTRSNDDSTQEWSGTQGKEMYGQSRAEHGGFPSLKGSCINKYSIHLRFEFHFRHWKFFIFSKIKKNCINSKVVLDKMLFLWLCTRLQIINFSHNKQLLEADICWAVGSKWS